RPIVLYDTRLDMADESLTLSRSRKEQQLPHSTLSSCELDDIDAERSSELSPQSLQQIKTSNTDGSVLATASSTGARA
ncbi:hypothetical protein PF011_g20645, partial [Phytophthora fragariae]